SEPLRLVAGRQMAFVLRSFSGYGPRYLDCSHNAGGQTGIRTEAISADEIQRIHGPIFAGSVAPLGSIPVGRDRPLRSLHPVLSRTSRRDADLDGWWPVSAMESRWARVVLRLPRQ